MKLVGQKVLVEIRYVGVTQSSLARIVALSRHLTSSSISPTWHGGRHVPFRF